MADVICLVDSDDDAPSPKRARRAPAGPSGVSLSPPRGGAPRGVERGSIDSQSSGGDLAVIATDATRAFTARASNLGRGRGRAAAAAADDDAWRRLGDVAEGRDDAADARERKRLDADRQRARRAAEKDAERARKAAERDEIRRRKAADAAADAARRAETRERDARERRARRDEASVATGRHKFKMLTVVLDAALAADAFGRALADALDGGVRDGGRGLTPLMHRAESLPLPWSVTWRYHPPSDAPVAAGDATARDATYTMLYLKAERFADMCVVDHEHEVALGRGGGGGGNGGDRTGGGGESPPAGGLRALLRDARATLPRGHALSLLVQGLEAHCVARERREHRARGIHGFSKKHVDVALARLYVGRGGRGLRVSTAQDMPHAVDAVVAVAVALARRPFEREETALDILGCASSTLAAGVALEAAAARGSRGAGVGVDGVHHGSSQATTEDGQNGESQNGESQSRGGGARRAKSQAEVWAGALMKIAGCAEASALSIVRAYPTMDALMRAYADASATEREKRELLKDLIRAGGAGGAERRVGPVLSERVYAVFRPRGADDAGGDNVGVGA